MSLVMSIASILMIVSMLVMPSETKVQHRTIEWESVLDGRIEAVAWNSLGDHLAFVTFPPTPAIVNLFDVETSLISSIQLPGAERSAEPVWSPDGQTVAVSTARHLYLLDGDTHHVTIADTGITGTISWSPDSSQIFIYTLGDLNNDVYVYDVTTTSLTLFLEVRSLGAIYNTALFDLSPDGAILALPNDQTHSIGFWNAQAELHEDLTRDAFEASTIACAPSEGDITTIDTIEWSTDSSALALGSYSGLDLCLFTEDGSLALRHLDSTPTYTAAWSPDGKYLASGTFQWADFGVGCEIRLFDILDGYQKSRVEIDQAVCSVFSISWAPDSQRIAVATNRGLWIGDL